MQTMKLRKQSFQPFLLGLGVVLCAAASPVARAACDCGSTDPAAPCTGTTVGRTVGRATLQLTVSCNGRACQCGQFPLGESWVVPIDDQGVNSTTVRVSAMHVDVSAAVANPDAHGGGQGLIYAAQEKDGTAIDAAEQFKRWGYKASLDVRTQLPYSTAAGTSILSAKTQRHSLCAGWHGGICALATDVVTVLGKAPPGAGSTVLRPPFAGTVKPLYSTTQLDLAKIPRYALVSATRTWDKPRHAQIVARWDQAFYTLCHSATRRYICHRGVYRAMYPISIHGRNYGPDLAGQYYMDLATIMDDAAISGDKLRAVYALFQQGMDLYWQIKAGAGGQNFGAKGAMAFFAALAKDRAILSEVQRLSAEHPDWFPEAEQIAVTTCAGDILWGHRWWEDDRPRLEKSYWSSLVRAQCFNGATKTCDRAHLPQSAHFIRDPYEFIDGPPALAGSGNIHCCSTGTFLGYTMLMYMMPELRHVANDERTIEFVRKHFLDLGDNSTNPLHLTQVKAIVRPDPCAPPTERDSRARCDPEKGTCLDYGKLWGPDPKRLGECIYHNGDVATDGRFGHLSDTETRQPTYRIGELVAQLWRNATFREAVAACEHTAQRGLCPTAP